ncbi:hypothetical protein QVZ43_10525 [Marinobacter sp. chi1]|uniref:PEP-CTERM sorting domain-containing protein n=1 Tax=Marinobacter suaedae TaxID=3057675 RepID=A0ABT8W1U7_9GAMM|nr:hypothetical protein [Marinobacter sp. chi1]MDO3722156.1 hypothetical protein [Marinobacter sp. chi1]
MKLLAIAVSMLVSTTLCARPITYVFGGSITNVSDSRFQANLEAGQANPDAYDWWPEVGDRYQGFITYDLDTLIYSDPGDSLNKYDPCWIHDICGGLVEFRIKLGNLWLSYDSASDQATPYSISWWAEDEVRFTGMGNWMDQFDSFTFNEGSFSGVHNLYFDGMAGKADRWVKVSEPSTLSLYALGLGILVYRRSLSRKKGPR